ncbi:sulfurtransferase TusA family protein [Paenibacillus methanolicus]|uniref:Rhodanese-related sulfurtransferase n=1 Tax=Paenibacillus methanolicus TaxID=582686 RepID=A0A5S5BUP0_9BACL|nr:sulfurtransferase TusA family protein [Paenibacillus methanolicus]TYP70036.1 rhodanese-related sulfurtransferase [Paenibacillus methanolicus]
MSGTSSIPTDFILDCKGLACPMPIVRTKKAMDQLQAGQVIEVQATDKGSLADLQGWAGSMGHHYLGTVADGENLRHFIRKASSDDALGGEPFARTATNEELQAKLASGETLTLLDVREPAEHAFGRIPDAVSIPLGELEKRANELPKDAPIYVICRTGTRSDLACRQLEGLGFVIIYNTIPGMSAWGGPLERKA